MPRLNDSQRRLVCAQARAEVAAARDRKMRGYFLGQADGVETAIDVLWPQEYQRLTELAKRIARRFGGLGEAA